jgi:hypothetical protein
MLFFLLRMANSQFLHQKVCFQSVFRVWAEMPPQGLQQSRICGTWGTLERNNCQRLEDAWFAWSATCWSGGLDAEIVWDFSSPEEFDRTLLLYHPKLREALFQSVVVQIPACPRCQHMLALISDGKTGAARRVCSNLNKFKTITELAVVIHTGCEAHCDSTHLYCAPCGDELNAISANAGALTNQRRVLDMRKGPPELQYMVEFEDGVARLLPRASIQPDIVRAFETTRSRRKRKRKPKRDFRGEVPSSNSRRMKRTKIVQGALSDAIILPMLPASSGLEQCQGADTAALQATALSPRVSPPTTSSSSSSTSAALEIIAPKDNRVPLESSPGSSAHGEKKKPAQHHEGRCELSPSPRESM